LKKTSSLVTFKTSPRTTLSLGALIVKNHTMNKLKSIILIIAIISTLVAQAQRVRSCHSHEASTLLMQKDANYAQRVADNSMIARKPMARLNTSLPYTIPVVVHVLYNTPQQNISDAQIASQFTALNKDYSKTNDNFLTSTPAAFQGLAGNAQIQFVLAKRDPNGNPTTGITRTATNKISFDEHDDMKFTARGGIEGWDPSKYLNIWVCNIDNNVLGYAYFPGASADIDGVVITYDCFGTIGTAVAPFQLGRTATHEIGHYLNLKHIWGDKSDCTGNDNVADTPLHHDANTGCRTYPYKVCPATTADGEMYMNYMDYSNDDCMSMFSQGQVDRMVSALTNDRASLLTSDGAKPFDLATDAALLNLVSPAPNENACGTLSPKIDLSNLGLDTLKSVDINVYVNQQLVSTKHWSGLLPSLQKTTVTLADITLTNTNNTLDFITNLPNNKTDENKSNDTLTRSILNIPTVSLPFMESFEGSTFPPANWSIDNPDKNITWEQATNAPSMGSKAVVIKNYITTGLNGEHDALISPRFTVKSNSSLSFYYAYKVYSSPYVASDTLTISVSNDCGITKNVVFKKGGQDLVVQAPDFTTSFYTPTTNAEWKKISISLAAYADQNVMLYFDNRTENENNLYLDSIYIDSNTITGIDENVTQSNVTIYPNPSAGNITIAMEGGYERLTCYNLMGSAVATAEDVETSVSTLDLKDLPKGIYMVNIKKGDFNFWEKIMLQ